MSTRSKKNNLITGLVVFILVFALVFFGVQWFTKSGIFKIPGVVYYDESLDEKELSLLNSLFTEDVVLDKDVTISAENYLQLPELNTNEYLYSISVPVTDYYSSDTNIEVDGPESLSTII